MDGQKEHSSYKQYHLIATILLASVFGVYFFSFTYLALESDGLILNRVYEITLLLIGISLYTIIKNYSAHVIKAWLLSGFYLISSLVVCGFVYDLSFDGQGYHQDAIITMSEYWNYIYSDSNAFHHLWIDHYPKASWLTASIYFELLGNIEMAKCTNLMLVIASYYLGRSFYQRLQIHGFWNVAISLLCAFDPINLNTFFSHTVDGQVSSMLLIIFYLIHHQYQRPSKVNLFLIIGAIVYAINLKFNAAVFVFLLLSAFLCSTVFTLGLKSLKNIIISSSVGVVLGFFVFGFNPYIKNVLTHQHPFYPVMGSGQQALGSDYLPSNMNGKNSIHKFLIANFSRTSFSKSFNKDTQLKVPFSVNRNEIETYAATGVMIAGFGPWFSGCMILGIFLFFLTLYKLKKKEPWHLHLACIIAFILVSTLITPLNWWARFVPQFWFLIPAVFVFGFTSNIKVIQNVSKILLIITGMNAILMMGYIVYQPMATLEIKERMLTLDKNKEYPVYFGQHGKSFEEKLKEANIKFYPIDNMEDFEILESFKLIEANILRSQ